MDKAYICLIHFYKRLFCTEDVHVLDEIYLHICLNRVWSLPFDMLFWWLMVPLKSFPLYFNVTSFYLQRVSVIQGTGKWLESLSCICSCIFSVPFSPFRISLAFRPGSPLHGFCFSGPLLSSEALSTLTMAPLVRWWWAGRSFTVLASTESHQPLILNLVLPAQDLLEFVIFNTTLISVLDYDWFDLLNHNSLLS